MLLFGARLWLVATWSLQNTNAAQYAAATAHVNPTAPVADPDSQEPAASQTGAKATEAADQTDKDKPKDEKHHDGAIVVGPLPIVSPAIGAGIIPVLGYIFPFEEEDKNSPPSIVGGAGLLTDKRQPRIWSWRRCFSEGRPLRAQVISTPTGTSITTCTASNM